MYNDNQTNMSKLETKGWKKTPQVSEHSKFSEYKLVIQ